MLLQAITLGSALTIDQTPIRGLLRAEMRRKPIALRNVEIQPAGDATSGFDACVAIVGVNACDVGRLASNRAKRKHEPQ